MIQYKRKDKEKFFIDVEYDNGVRKLIGEFGNVIIIGSNDFNKTFNFVNKNIVVYQDGQEPFYEILDKIVNDENDDLSYYILRNNIGSKLKMRVNLFNRLMTLK